MRCDGNNLRKLSSSTSPDFNALKTYFLEFSDSFEGYKSDGVRNNGSAIVFGDSNNPDQDMTWFMNQAEWLMRVIFLIYLTIKFLPQQFTCNQ